VNLRDIEQAIADEKARIDAAHAAVAEAREALERAERAQIEATLKAEARIVALEAAAALFEQEHDSDLHTLRGSASNKHMHAAPETTKRMGRPITSKHPLAIWIKANGGLDALAAKLKKPASTVRSWYAEPPYGRPCPPEMQAIFEKAPYNIPTRAWKNRPSR
jgi:hypothetical protein